MSSNIKVTSITYVKNCEEYIERCIRSIMNQSLKEIEIIVVDGGSTDETLNILKQLKSEDSRLEILNVQGSVGAQFNAALSMAKGEYVAVCEGDDFISLSKYEKQYKIASENKIDVLRACYSLYFNQFDEEHIYKVGIAPDKELYDKVIETNDELFLSTFVNGFWNGLYSREFLQLFDIKMNETKGAAYQDITFSFLTQLYARKIWFMSEPYHFYRIDNPNSSVNSLRCIELLGKEYGLLMNILKERNLWRKYSYMFLIWEITSYIQFIDRFPQNEKKDILSRVYKTLNTQNISYEFDMSGLYFRAREAINALLVDEDAFYSAITQIDNQISKMLRFFKCGAFEKEKNIILFGAGHFGGIIYDFLMMFQKNISIVDNSEEIQEKGFRNSKVFSSEFCVHNNHPIIIANVNNSRDIYTQLINLGVDSNRIIICDNEDLFLREVYVGFGFQ